MNEIQFILYNLPEEDGKVQVVIKDETIWATQKAMSQLFGVGVPAINKHLKNIFDEKELDAGVVISKMEITTQHGAIEGKQQHVTTSFYSLDAIIAVGYRVSSARATKFRIWATKILNEFIRKGFVLDDERLKRGEKEHMGLTTWKNAAEGRILKSDVTVAKNYLSEQEIRKLERAVTGFFDYIEDLIEDEHSFSMSQFSDSVNAFLNFRNYKILEGKGKISKAVADAKAEKEYNIFNKTQPIFSDFDKEIKKLKAK